VFVQVEIRWDEVMTDTFFLDANDVWQAGIKFFGVGAGDKVGGEDPDPFYGITHYYSSSDAKSIIQTYYQFRYPHVYGYGPDGVGGATDKGLWDQVAIGDFDKQNGLPLAPVCTTSNAPSIDPFNGPVPVHTDCWTMPSNTWVTFTFELDLGPRELSGGWWVWTNARRRLWAQLPGEASVRLVNFTENSQGYYHLTSQLESTDYDVKIGKVHLFPFMTNKSATQVHDTGRVWYRNLIISRIRPPDRIMPEAQPEWVPNPGYYIALTESNEMRDVAAAGSLGVQSLITVIDNWNSAMFVPDVSPYGMYINAGSGHSNRHDAIYGQTFAAEASDCDWERLSTMHVYPDDWSENNGQGRNPDGAIPSGLWDSPTPPHTYDSLLHIPASVFGNTKGALCYPVLQAVGDAAIIRWYAWFFNLDTATWTVSTNAVPASAQTGYSSSASCVWDSERECVWLLAKGNPSHLGKLEKIISNWTWTSVAHDEVSLNTSGVVGGFCPDLDCCVWWAPVEQKLIIWEPASETLTWNATQSGTAPRGGDELAQYACGLEWCPHPSIKKFYGMDYVPNPSYPDASASHYYPSPTARTLTPPASLPGTWTWGSETFTAQGGVTAIGNTSINQRYNALRWMNPRNESEKINAFAWANDVDGPTNILRPAAAV
jgi:hypothetical protein